MKKIIIIILLTVTYVDAKSLLNNRFQTAQSSEKLVLNNGAKWKVDKPTGNNVAILQQIIRGDDGNTAKSLPDYRKAGIMLQNGIAKMIKECRMKGLDHEALHKWLEPLVEQVANLNRANNAKAAARSYGAIILRLKLFDQYFRV